MKKLIVLFSSLLLITSLVLAQGLAGTWTLKSPDGQVFTLVIQNVGSQITGTLSSANGVFTLEGRSSGNRAEGILSNDTDEGFFSMLLSGNTLQFTFGDFDASGQADQSTAQQVVFTRAGASSTTKPTTPTATAPNNTKPAASGVTRVAASSKLPNGTTARAGAKYTAGIRVNILNHGISFVVPKGFSGQTAGTPNGNVTFFSLRQTANIFIWAFTGLEPRDASAWLEYPIDLDSVKLEPVGTPTVQNGVLSARHTHPQLESMTSIVFSKSNAIGFTVFTTKATQNQLEGIIKALNQSAKFAPSPLENTVSRLRQGLNGRYLLMYSFTGAGSGNVGGTERQRRWDLCSNGQYAYFGKTESSYSSNNYWAGTNTSFFSSNGADQVGAWRTFAINDVFGFLTISSQGELDLQLLTNVQGAGGKLPFLNGKELGAFGKSDKCS